MRRSPSPLRVTRPPPSRTTDAEVLTTFAVLFIAIVTGSGPQSKVISPPLATARTTAREVHEAGRAGPDDRAARLRNRWLRRARSARHETRRRGSRRHQRRDDRRGEGAGPHHSAFSMSLLSFSGSVVGA